MSDLDALHQQKILNRQYPQVQYTPEGALVVEIAGSGPMPEGTSDAPQGSAMPKADGQVDEAQLRSDPMFLQDVGAIHQAFTGRPFQGDAGALADWGIEKLANFELAMGDMTNPSGDAAGGGMIGQASQILNNFTPEQAGSFLRALDAYDKLPMFTMPGFGRLVRNLAADPTSIVGAATVGAGLVGRQAARATAKEGIKTALRQRVGQAILANPVKVGAGEAAAYTGTADVIKQKVEIQGGKRQEVDQLQAGAMAAVGGAAGAGLVKGVQVAAPVVGNAIKKGIENLQAPGTPKVGPGGQRGAVGDLKAQPITFFDSKALRGDVQKEGLKDGIVVDDLYNPKLADARYKKAVERFPIRTDRADMDAPTQVVSDKMTKEQRKERFGTLSDGISDTFLTRLDDESLAFMKWIKSNDNKTSVFHQNGKTGNSIDFSTSCAKRGCGAGACAYCYVENARVLAKAFGQSSQPKLEGIENVYRDEVLRMPKNLIEAYNMDGGLRMFSFGDFRPNVDDDGVARLLADAEKRGLYIKAITKEIELIKRFGKHPNLRANLSVDNVPREVSHSFTLDEAIAVKKDYPNVRLRVVALNLNEAEMFAANPNVDVITMYHGKSNWDHKGNYTGNLTKLIREQNPEIFTKMGDAEAEKWLDSWQNMPFNSPKTKEFREKYEGRVCCTSGKCAGDPTKCGFANKVAEAGGVALLILGGSHTIFLGEADDNQVMWQ